MEAKVEGSLRGIEQELQEVLARREKILKTSRDCIAFCSKAIVHLHAGKKAEARREIKDAEKVLEGLRKEAGTGPLSRYLPSPEAEYVEASTVEAVILGKPIPGVDELEVSNEGYLMGLLDAVGEIKRLLLDAIMRGETEKAQKFFDLMEELYSTLAPFAAYDHAANGIRRKIDVARILTEDVRGVMAEEARRSNLVSTIRELQSSLEGKKRPRR